ncbi:MAG: metal dependent phosphohydrolase [Actinobacteria bacterium]|nr:metal dependent phosphohydrolase [Actinomycetota bacterium]
MNGAAPAQVRLPGEWLGDSRAPALHLRPLRSGCTGSPVGHPHPCVTSAGRGGVERLTALLGEHDPSTLHHSFRVARLVVAMAARLGMPAREHAAVSLAGLLHDVGKIAVPRALLVKPTPLSEEEAVVLRDHAAMGGWMVEPFVSSDVAHAVRHHHERFDGQGYPGGLGAGDLPWMTRAVAVADTYDALVSQRPYREGCCMFHAFRELHRVAGSQLDGELVEVLIGAVTTTPAALLVA